MNKQQKFEQTTDELIELYKAKNKAYGNSFSELQAEEPIDKLNEKEK